jgi:hypothetical protein
MSTLARVDNPMKLEVFETVRLFSVLSPETCKVPEEAMPVEEIWRAEAVASPSSTTVRLEVIPPEAAVFRSSV